MEPVSIRKELGIVDYFAFIALLLTSVGIGVYFAIRDRKTNSMNNYYFGGKQMNPIAVGLSLAVTFQSSVAVLASPAEAYISGSLVLWTLLMEFVAVPIALLYFIPVYHRLQLRTLYEYLELRFCTGLRRLAAGVQILGTIFYMGTVVYLPAAALNAITPLPLVWGIFITGAICTFYTTLGGMKGVIWTDVLQSIIMILGTLAVFLRGLYVVGGFGEVFASLERGARFTAHRFDFGVISRLSPLAVIIGGFFTSFDNLCFSQEMIQRYQACRKTRHAQYALLVYVLPTTVILLLIFGNGFIMYAYFEGCDPVESGKLETIDQGVAYMALEIFEFIPGLAGLFISAIYGAALSTVSSSLNSLSVIILEDFLMAKWPSMSERVKVMTGKILIVVVGSLVVAMAFVIASSESDGLELLYGFLGLIYGPLGGVYILGFFFPWTNKTGALCGIFSGYATLAFMSIGKNFFNNPSYGSNLLAVSTDLCPVNITSTAEPVIVNSTTMDMFETDYSAVDPDIRTFLRDIYNINYYLFICIGLLVSVAVGLAASFISGHTLASDANPNLFIPLIDNKMFPDSVNKFFRFGVRDIDDNEELQTDAPTDASNQNEQDVML